MVAFDVTAFKEDALIPVVREVYLAAGASDQLVKVKNKLKRM